jgi:putative transposase
MGGIPVTRRLVSFRSLSGFYQAGEICSPQQYSEGIGMDMGIKDFATSSMGEPFKNINQSSEIKRTEKRLKRCQRSLSRKYESNLLKLCHSHLTRLDMCTDG